MNADIATADDGNGVVHHHDFVMHTMIDPIKIGDEIPEPPTAVVEWIKAPDFDIGMCIQRGNNRIASQDAVVVNQQANAHAALSRADQSLGKNAAGAVVVPDII